MPHRYLKVCALVALATSVRIADAQQDAATNYPERAIRIIVSVPAVWAAFLTYYGGFLILFLLAFTGLTVTVGTISDGKGTIAG